MLNLIEDEIRTLRILAGHLPLRIGAREVICIQELQAHGLCELEEPPRLSPQGVKILEETTGTVDFRSRRKKGERKEANLAAPKA